jgi:hypothetical protein
MRLDISYPVLGNWFAICERDQRTNRIIALIIEIWNVVNSSSKITVLGLLETAGGGHGHRGGHISVPFYDTRNSLDVGVSAIPITNRGQTVPSGQLRSRWAARFQQQVKVSSVDRERYRLKAAYGIEGILHLAMGNRSCHAASMACPRSTSPDAPRLYLFGTKGAAVSALAGKGDFGRYGGRRFPPKARADFPPVQH